MALIGGVGLPCKEHVCIMKQFRWKGQLSREKEDIIHGERSGLIEKEGRRLG